MSEIRTWSSAVLDALEAGGITHLEPTDGFYWSLETADAWDMTRLPEPTVGDLADDVADIRKDLSEYQDIADKNAWHTLDHLIGVLSALSQQHKQRHGINAPMGEGGS